MFRYFSNKNNESSCRNAQKYDVPAALPPAAFHAVSPGFQPGYRRADCDLLLHFRFFDHFIFIFIFGISGLRPIGMFGSPDFDTPPGVSFLRTKNLFQKPDNSRIGKPPTHCFRRFQSKHRVSATRCNLRRNESIAHFCSAVISHAANIRLQNCRIAVTIAKKYGGKSLTQKERPVTIPVFLHFCKKILISSQKMRLSHLFLCCNYTTGTNRCQHFVAKFQLYGDSSETVVTFLRNISFTVFA